jgi:polysaccharide biosynthesis/export protein
MSIRLSLGRRGSLAVLAACLLAGMMAGRHSIYAAGTDASTIPNELDFQQPEELPRELAKVSLPTYRIEPPDTLQIEMLKLVPRPPYRIGIYDVLRVSVRGTIRDQPINSYYLVEAEGIVSLGSPYGPVRVVGMTIAEATDEMTRQLQLTLQRPEVSILLIRSAGTQQLSGMYQVQPDGMVSLHGYGMVHVAGKTVTEARIAVAQHLAQYFDTPQVAVDVVGYNSQNYYVIAAGFGTGEVIQRCPISGNETVLDALSQMQLLPRVLTKTLWVARPAPGKFGCEQILPVDWVAISRGGMTDTNYQLLPGDRIFIVDDNLVAANKYLVKFTTPIERLLHISLLGSSTINNTQVLGRSFNQNRR